MTQAGRTMLRLLERDWSQDGKKRNCAKKILEGFFQKDCESLRKLNIMGFRLNVSQSSDLSIPGCREAQGGRISIGFEREAFSLCAGPGIGKLCGLG